MVYDKNGNKFIKDSSYHVIGYKLDEYKNYFDLYENYIVKIDVDGIEHLIIDGGIKTLQDYKCKSILIETNFGFYEQSEQILNIMSRSGFDLENIADYQKYKSEKKIRNLIFNKKKHD